MKIERSNTTPYINLSLEENKFEIRGNAFSNTVNDLFNEILVWMEINIPNLEKELDCVFSFHVLNSVTQKNFLIIFQKLETFIKNGKKIKVTWYYDTDDDEMMEMVDDIRQLYSVPIELKMITRHP